MKAKLETIREALEYSIGHIKSSIYSEQTNPNTHYTASESSINHHNLVIDSLTLIDELLAELESGEISDGYHTFNELYEHRHSLFALNIAVTPEISWKSLKHDDGTMFDGWFIAGMDLPTGVITYHIPIRLWDLFECKDLAAAPKWDGHTSNDVIERVKAVINVIKGV